LCPEEVEVWEVDKKRADERRWGVDARHSLPGSPLGSGSFAFQGYELPILGRLWASNRIWLVFGFCRPYGSVT
jgi:hypothetical protein